MTRVGTLQIVGVNDVSGPLAFEALEQAAPLPTAFPVLHHYPPLHPLSLHHSAPTTPLLHYPLLHSSTTPLTHNSLPSAHEILACVDSKSQFLPLIGGWSFGLEFVSHVQ